MVTGGVGSKNNFSLDWERLLKVVILKGLSVSDQNKILKKFETLEVSVVNMSKCLQTLSVVSGNNSSQGVNSISSNQNNSPNFIKSKMKTASMADGCYTRCGGNSVFYTIQGVVATLSQAVSAPTPRVLENFIQDGTPKGEITILPDSGSVAEVMPVALASSLNLAW